MSSKRIVKGYVIQYLGFGGIVSGYKTIMIQSSKFHTSEKTFTMKTHKTVLKS